MDATNLLRIADVAKRLGLSASTVYQLVAQRKISHRRIGGAIRFQESDIEEFLDATKRGRKSSDSWPTTANPEMYRPMPKTKIWF